MTVDRLQDSLRRVNQALNPRQVYSMCWEYTVLSASPGPPTKIDCQVVDAETSAHLPQQLTQMVLWPGPSGAVAVPAPGSIVRIGFINGDPGKPFVQGLDPNQIAVMVVVDASAEVQVGPSAPVVQLAGGATPLVLATPYEALLAALTTFASSMAAAAGPPPFTPLAAAPTALGMTLANLPSPATLKVTAA